MDAFTRKESAMPRFKTYNLLKPAERIMMGVGAVAVLVSVPLVLLRGTAVDYGNYSFLAMIVIPLIGLGLFYRISGRSERIASAIICTVAFAIFTNALNFFNYAMLPTTGLRLDTYIAAMDAFFGFHWPSAMAWLAELPTLNVILQIAYASTLPQFAVIIITMGLLGRYDDLHHFALCVTITATLTICFWLMFPTFGAKSMFELPPEIWQAVAPIVDAQYAKDVVRISTLGPAIISPEETRGLIAFPSYHAVLAFTAMYAVRNIWWLVVPLWPVNLLILPATVFHGGHHAMDAPAGLLMFLLGVVLANQLMNSASFARLSNAQSGKSVPATGS